jgi:putative (di)nucleoside polyphosphate hydrolase
MTDCIDREGFRANVGIILLSRVGAVFWAGRAGRPGWQFPQGGIRPEESPEEAMYRELSEEIGLAAHDVEVAGWTRRWLRYRLPKRYVRRDSDPVCVGQKQRWFLLRLVNDAPRVRFDATAAPEFDRWRWVDYWHPVREVIYFKRRVYARALDELWPLANPDGAPPRPDWIARTLAGRPRSRRGSRPQSSS